MPLDEVNLACSHGHGNRGIRKRHTMLFTTSLDRSIPLGIAGQAGPAAPAALDMGNVFKTLPARPVDGLYVHIPFCFHKCHYCDFYSITRQTPERMDNYVRLL